MSDCELAQPRTGGFSRWAHRGQGSDAVGLTLLSQGQGYPRVRALRAYLSPTVSAVQSLRALTPLPSASLVG